MNFKLFLFFITDIIISKCYAAVYILQLPNYDDNEQDKIYLPTRRYLPFHPGNTETILGSPTSVNHLPEAEPVLPGHTLLRPSFAMLRSSIKFPHKDPSNGSGVYGNTNNLGLTGSRGHRVLYTGFRRNLIKDPNTQSGLLVLLLPKNKRSGNTQPIYRQKDWDSNYEDIHKAQNLKLLLQIEKAKLNHVDPSINFPTIKERNVINEIGYNFDYEPQKRYENDVPDDPIVSRDTKYAYLDLVNISEKDIPPVTKQS